MLPTEIIRDPNSPGYAAVRARLARAYLEHKADLGVLLADDVEVVKRIDEITVLLCEESGRALRKGNLRWLQRYHWFTEVVDELQGLRPEKPLDG